MQVFVRDADMQRYHDIYDVSMQDYADAIAFANKSAEESQDCLKELRFLFRLHFIARKVFLCDLLALHSGSTWQNIRQWRNTLQLLQDLEAAFAKIAESLQSAMAREAFVNDVSNATLEDADQFLGRDAELRTLRGCIPKHSYADSKPLQMLFTHLTPKSGCCGMKLVILSPTVTKQHTVQRWLATMSTLALIYGMHWLNGRGAEIQCSSTSGPSRETGYQGHPAFCHPHRRLPAALVG